LFLNGKGANQGGHLFSGFPFSQLTKSFLTSPDTSVDDLEEELTRTGIEDEDGAI
jgi:hypothetical protein